MVNKRGRITYSISKIIWSKKLDKNRKIHGKKKRKIMSRKVYKIIKMAQSFKPPYKKRQMVLIRRKYTVISSLNLWK